MIQMDCALIRRARQLKNGANVQLVENLIFAYQQAVILHNERWPEHIYQQQSEEELRKFAASESARQAKAAVIRWQDAMDLRERNRSVMQRAAAAIKRSQSLQERCDELNERVDAALSLQNRRMHRAASATQETT